MADEPTPGELYRRFQDHEQRTDRIHSELDNRITRMAAESVPLDVWHQAERARDQQHAQLEREQQEALRRLRDDTIKPLQADVKELKKRPRGNLVIASGVAVAVIALLALVVQTWSAAKGAH